MKKATTHTRRTSALSRDRIVEEAIALLDAHGEQGLTFRALSERLATGPGAIYWHIDNRRDLLIAACDAAIAGVMDGPNAELSAAQGIAAIAAGLFDAIDAHPWIGAALNQAGGERPMIRIIESLGQKVCALGVAKADQWPITSALTSYIVGVGVQNAAQAQLAQARGWDRHDHLTAMAQSWSALDAGEYPFTRSMSGQLPAHDDRVDFLVGVELILAGISTKADTDGPGP